MCGGDFLQLRLEISLSMSPFIPRKIIYSKAVYFDLLRAYFFPLQIYLVYTDIKTILF